MAKAKAKVKAGQPAPAVDTKAVLCPNCADKTPPVKSTMSPRGSDALSCGTCNCWMLKSQIAPETKAQRVARLKAELKAAESE